MSDIIKSGVDLVMFSGDKLLGGPQAGIIAGRRDIIATLKSHPLMRAVRVDKLSLAALEATLRLYRPPFDPLTDVPVLAMLAEPLTDVETRATTLLNALEDAGVTGANVVQSTAFVGAGALPQEDLQSYALTLRFPDISPQVLSAALRKNDPPVIGRIERGRVMLDMRTVRDGELSMIVSALTNISNR